MRIANKVNFKKSSCQDVFTQIHAGDCSFYGEKLSSKLLYVFSLQLARECYTKNSSYVRRTEI